VAGVPVLGVWVDDRQLEEIERRRASAICVIPWLRDDISHWRYAYAPIDVRSGAAAPSKSKIDNPVVERAITDLTSRVNLSTGLAHPSDKAAAVGMFRIPRDADEPVGFANSGGLVFMDESAEEIPTL
jgi:hypothetical protein